MWEGTEPTGVLLVVKSKDDMLPQVKRLRQAFRAASEGTATRVGAVDHLLGAFRLGGFRVDVVWLVFSTVATALAGLIFLLNAKTVTPHDSRHFCAR